MNEVIARINELAKKKKSEGLTEAEIADARYKYISKYFSPALKRKNKGALKMTASDKADKVLTHKIWGFPILLGILFLMFQQHNKKQ